MTNPKLTLSNRGTRGKHPRPFDIDCTSLSCTFRSVVESVEMLVMDDVLLLKILTMRYNR